jgi:CheY-like chemotaxis protein
MIEQVLLNLAVNARDAMPHGGQLIITTDQVSVPDAVASERPFIRIRVQDTGCGMTAAVKARIFEPFFTTKEVGKGTGLGLATVFGIVKQHCGAVEVESEIGRGTIFSILLPACDEQPEVTIVEPSTSSTTPAGGSETILLVEDEPLLRELALAVLSGAGYKVLEAGEAADAFAVWNEHQDEIALLLTDMVLPGGMNGRDLAAEFQRTKPELKVIYTTGYSSDILDAPLNPTNFLQKPYPPEVLARTVRACLDAN